MSKRQKIYKLTAEAVFSQPVTRTEGRAIIAGWLAALDLQARPALVEGVEIYTESLKLVPRGKLTP